MKSDESQDEAAGSDFRGIGCGSFLRTDPVCGDTSVSCCGFQSIRLYEEKRSFGMKKKTTGAIGILLSTVMAVTSAAAGVPMPVRASDPASADGGVIYQLKVNSITEPLGIDTTEPVFSWKLNLTGYDRAQSAYQIIVSSSREKAEGLVGDLWDSGRVAEEDNYDIVYKGEALRSETRYFWRVKVWDSGNLAYGWSEVASFETGIMTAAEWQGKWIGVEEHAESLSPEGGKWIWLRQGADFAASPGGHMYFRKTFAAEPTKQVSRVLLGFTADDRVTAYVNGEKVGYNASWSIGTLVDITKYFAAGTNQLAFDAVNDSTGYAGMLCKVQISYSDGSSSTVVSDGSGWRVSKTVSDGWTLAGYNDSSWLAPDQTDKSFGVSPWGNSAVFEFQASRAATVLRKEFSADKGEIASARAYVCGLGYFELKINGQLPDDTLLNPANTQYTQTVLYRTFDVTSLLKEGKNAVGVELGNGFFNETCSVWGWQKAKWRGEPRLLLKLVIRYQNGETQTVLTDESWKVTKQGPTTTNSIYYGETYDARKELTGYDKADYDDSLWENADLLSAPAGELKAQTMEPIRRTKELKPSKITKLPSGSYVLTVPEMLAGWIKLNIKGASQGDTVTITYGEKLNADGQVQKLGGPDGVNSSWWPLAYNQQDNYICKGGANETFEPKFSYKGYQYVQIDNYKGELTAADVTCYRVSNDMPVTGQFESSSELFNKLHQMMMTTMDNNMQGKPTDTPVWEKNGWLGDANVATETMAYNYDLNGMFTSFIETMEDCLDEFGTVPNMVPTEGWGVDNTVVWNSIFVFGVEQLFKSYGSESYLADQYDAMRKLALLDISRSQSRGWTWDDGQLADWVSPMGTDENEKYNESPNEGSGIVGTAFAYHLLDVMAQFADRLGKTADAAQYRSAMANIFTAFNNKFYRPEQGIYETTTWSNNGPNRTRYRQTSQLVPLAFGLVPETYRKTVVDNLVKDITDKGYHLDTGCVGSKFILPVLTDYGYADVAYRIAAQTTYPSWGFMAERGTSLWEMWESTARSLGHYFLGTYDEWFYKGVGGIREMEDGYKTVTLAPTPGGDLTWAKTSVDTVRGLLQSNWTLNANKTADFDFVIPVGTTATIRLPAPKISEVTADGQPLSQTLPGIRSVSVVDGQVQIVAGSGSYHFVSAVDIPVEKIALKSAIDAAALLQQSDYDAGAWSDFAAVLAAAVEVFESGSSSQQQVNEQAAALKAAAEELQKHVDTARVDLKAKVAELEGLTINPVEYPASYFTAYELAFRAARDGCTALSLTSEQLIALKNNLETAYDALQEHNSTNLALHAPVTAASSHEDSSWNWGKANLTDGDRKNQKDSEYTGYSSALGSRDKDHEEWITVDLGSVQECNAVTLYASTQTPGQDGSCYGFPKTFEIQVSQNGTDWETVLRKENYPVPGYGPISFQFEAVDAQYVRLYAFQLNPKVTDYNFYYMQLCEMEVYRIQSDKSALHTAIADAEALRQSAVYRTAGETAKAGFDAALNQAKEVSENPDAFNIEIIDATLELADASVALIEDSVMPGDLNGDRQVNAADVVKLRALVRAGTHTDEELAAGDLNEDSKLDGEDVALLLQQLGILRGDASGDGKVNALDVMTIRKALLTDDVTEAKLAAGDLDGDGVLKALDIMLLRKMLMEQT